MQLEPVRQVLPFDWLTTDHLVWGESTLHEVTGYTFSNSIENFSAYQPSLAQFYSAAALAMIVLVNGDVVYESTKSPNNFWGAKNACVCEESYRKWAKWVFDLNI